MPDCGAKILLGHVPGRPLWRTVEDVGDEDLGRIGGYALVFWLVLFREVDGEGFFSACTVIRAAASASSGVAVFDNPDGLAASSLRWLEPEARPFFFP